MTLAPPPAAAEDLHHGTLLYADEAEYLAGVLPFVHRGLEQDEAILLNADAGKTALVRARLGLDASRLASNDMAVVGANPARLLPLLMAFVADRAAAGQRVRVVGEPIHAGRRQAELDECDLHEAIVSTAVPSGAVGRLLCPYDVSALPEAAVALARLTHPAVVEGDATRPSRTHDPGAAMALFRRALPEPSATATELRFDLGDLAAVRRLVSSAAMAAGLLPARAEDLVLAVTEVATNSIRHGGGSGTVRVWSEDDAVVADVRDIGQIHDPAVGRLAPRLEATGGRGIWIANQLCDLVQVRSPTEGANVRLHMWLR
jgi:anti-sigma regulatory factor (Ser/Thr protein kinase)